MRQCNHARILLSYRDRAKSCLLGAEELAGIRAGGHAGRRVVCHCELSANAGSIRTEEAAYARSKGIDRHQQLASALGQPDLRIYDCTTYLEPTPAGSDDPYIAVPGVARSRRRTFPAPTSSTCRASSPIHHAAALHDAGDGAARGRIRPSRHRARAPAWCSTASAA